MVRRERRRTEQQNDDVFSESDTMDQQDLTEVSCCPFNSIVRSDDSALDQIDTFLRNVQVLLKAANYIERNEKPSGKCEHGYASTCPSSQNSNYQRQRKFRNKKSSSNDNRIFWKDRHVFNLLQKSAHINVYRTTKPLPGQSKAISNMAIDLFQDCTAIAYSDLNHLHVEHHKVNFHPEHRNVS
ncbi:UNVERIFIED_CONTAM: hypothetical protein FKN15_031483 [Acipenser sinensis]